MVTLVKTNSHSKEFQVAMMRKRFLLGVIHEYAIYTNLSSEDLPQYDSE
jgi:hypothetical protein